MVLERTHPYCTNYNCPLINSCNQTATQINRSIYHTADNPVDILFVGEHPSSREMLHPLAFLGPEKQLIEEVLISACPDSTIAYTYLVRGWPVDLKKSKFYADKPNTIVKHLTLKEISWLKTLPLSNHPERQQIISNCSKFLLKDIEQLKPKLIILFGNSVKEALFPNERKLSRNSVKNLNGYTVRFMPSYISVFKNPSSKKSWQSQLTSIILNNEVEIENELNSKIHVIKDLNEAIEYIESLKETYNEISFDIETLNLNKKYGNKIATLQFSETNNSSTIIPYNHKESPFLPDEIETLRQHLYDLFKYPSKIKCWVGHNLKFECNLLASIIGTPLVSAPMFDTMVGAFLLDENRQERVTEFKYGVYSLKQLAFDYLNFDGYDKSALSARDEGNLFTLPLQELANYGGMDTIVTRRLYFSELEHARKQNYYAKFLKLMYYHYTPNILLFSDIEQNGFFLNRNSLRKLLAKDSIIVKAISDILTNLKNIPEVQKANDILLQKDNYRVNFSRTKPWIFNFAKKNHPQTLFFNVCNLRPLMIGKSGIGSIDAEWQKQNEHHPLVKVYTEWSTMTHLYDSFVTTLYDRVNPQKDYIDSNKDCCIRPNFNIIGTVTGRTSCNDPNLQNIPRSDSPAKKAIKNIFSSLPKHYLVQMDYKANEIRWVGILAQDDNLAKALWQGKHIMDEYRLNPNEDLIAKAEIYGDIHKQTASMVFNKPLEEVTKNERQISKSVIFAILYGSTITAVAQKMNVTSQEVEKWFKQFYTRFPKIEAWKHKTEEMAKHVGFVETANGRRRRFPIFNLFKDQNGYFSDNNVPSDYRSIINGSLRQCVNSPIQGIASDYGMCGAALFSRYIREQNKSWKICNAVHDSCVFQVPYNELEDALEQAEYWFTTGITEYMADIFEINFNLPLEVDFEIGLSWGSLQKWNFSKQELDAIKAKLKASEM